MPFGVRVYMHRNRIIINITNLSQPELNVHPNESDQVVVFQMAWLHEAFLFWSGFLSDHFCVHLNTDDPDPWTPFSSAATVTLKSKMITDN